MGGGWHSTLTLFLLSILRQNYDVALLVSFHHGLSVSLSEVDDL